MVKKTSKSKKTKKTPKIRFEEQMFRAADKLRKNIGADEYKHVVLGLIFLRFVSDSFSEKYNKLVEENKQGKDVDPENKLEYVAANTFWVPTDCRWKKIQDSAKLPAVGNIIDDAIEVIEQENESLKGVLPREYGRPALDKQKLGELIDIISSIDIEKQNLPNDILGRIYEYFLGRFASISDDAGQFYTPQTVVELLVNLIEPFRGRVFDPCCGSGGMFVQSQRFVSQHENENEKGDISIFGQESNRTTWRLCKMNLALRKMGSGNILWNNEGSFLNDLHKELKADFILANPPFNDSDWSGDQLREDSRWVFGAPPESNANYAWVQNFLSHLEDEGYSAFLLSNGSLSATENDEETLIRKSILRGDKVDCIITLPTKLFYSTQVPVSVWVVTHDKKNPKLRKREGETLFIHAKEKGRLIDRRHRELTPDDISLISNTYHSWRGSNSNSYENIPGFCYSANLKEIENHKWALVPGRYAGAKSVIDEEEPFTEQISVLSSELKERSQQSQNKLKTILEKLKEIRKND